MPYVTGAAVSSSTNAAMIGPSVSPKIALRSKTRKSVIFRFLSWVRDSHAACGYGVRLLRGAPLEPIGQWLGLNLSH